MAAMLLYQTNPVRVQLFSNVNTLFCDKFAWLNVAGNVCAYALYSDYWALKPPRDAVIHS